LKALRIGTRGSPLALWQANSIAEALRHAGTESELVIVKTSGDKFQQASFSKIAGKGVFIKELEDALLDRRVDLAVHSMKDVPTEIPKELVIAAICKREDVRDALISMSGARFANLPRGARIGTGSLRRRAQLLHVRSDLQMLDIRGNVDTRLEKLKRGDYDAIVLAKAGLDRLGLRGTISEVLSTEISLPAAGQGAIGIEARADDGDTLRAVAGLDDPDTRAGVEAERAALARLEGGCQVSIGAWGRVQDGQLALEVAVLSADGRERLWEKVSGSPTDAAPTGLEVAARLIERGARDLLVREGRGTTA
jgi:hydroxymethylbilane synthase